jgi:hypothetical protein
MECIILPNSLFDDGSLECKTFVVCLPNQDTIVCEFSYILKYHSDKVDLIKAAIAAGKSYIGYLIPSSKPLSFGVTESYCEIQWD